MKKVISVILNILSIISAAAVLLFGGFCIYDWVTLSQTSLAYSIDFWLVVDYYAVALLILSGAGLVLSLINVLIKPDEKIKKTAKFLLCAFAIVLIVSVVLYLLPFNF